MRVEPKALVRCLTPTATRYLETAVGKAVSAQHYEIEPEHLLLALMEDDDGDAARILSAFEQDRNRLIGKLRRMVDKLRSGNARRPVFSSSLFQWLEDAWLLASVERGEVKLRSGALLLALVQKPERYMAEPYAELDPIDAERLKRELDEVAGATSEAAEAAPGLDRGAETLPASGAGPSEQGALGRFTANLTEAARGGKIDPILGRHREIRQMIDILSRRRKNNPIIVGEPGVGKTALVEGLALSIANGEVPESMREVELLSLDLGLLQAGASVKGEFENRLKQVISETKASPRPIVLFIDEAHTIIGAGGPRGGGDAANLLKPALARGELRTVAATTWAEFKKYFEKDAALERRFQPVKVDEPDEHDAVIMLRAIRPIYEAAHGVTIRDDAVVAAVRLSQRYISGRQLPDKAVDLLDTAAARVRVERAAPPEGLVALDTEVVALESAVEVIGRDVEDGAEGQREELRAVEEQLGEARRRRDELHGRWQGELQALQQLLRTRERVAAAGTRPSEGADPEPAKPGSDSGPEPADVEQLRAEARQAAEALEAQGGEDRLVHVDVDADAVARTVAAWTGVPVGKMRRDEIANVLHLRETLAERVIGQDHAIGAVAETLRIANAGIANPDSPIGTMLFVGPSGVGKTETALALADLLYGGERFLTTINMSEFQEKHTVSRLIGSPPGYVGYGEGGVLTEAVRQRPYSVVLLDECEKADLEVMNLFYQVFDKGVLSDGEGRPINFRNTLIILTSNLASEQIVQCFENQESPQPDEVVGAIRPTLSRHFQPALLARMSIVPFAPIGPEAMRAITRLKLGKLVDRVERSHALRASFSDELVEQLAQRCTESETGARNIDHVLRGSLMPALATSLLEQMAEGLEHRELDIGLAASGDWRFDFR